MGRTAVMLKKPFLVSLVVLLAVFLTSTVAYSRHYIITKVSGSTATFDESPWINDRGQVVWVGWNHANRESKIFLYNGTSISQISDAGSTMTNFHPMINAKGQVVWEGKANSRAATHIYLHDATLSPDPIRLSEGLIGNGFPWINDSGQVVWVGFTDTGSEIFLYNGTTPIQLSEESTRNQFPHMNDSGQVVWQGYDDTNCTRVFFHNGAGITRLKINNYCPPPHGIAARPRINAKGQVLSVGTLFSPVNEILLFDSVTATPILLSEGTIDNYIPLMNDSGQVVWCGSVSPGPEFDIFFHDGTIPPTPILLSEGLVDNFGYRINNNGQVVWSGRVSREVGGDIYLYDRTISPRPIPLTVDDAYDHSPMINAKGQVVWSKLEEGVKEEIYLATPVPVSVPIDDTPPGTPVTTSPDLSRRIEITDYCTAHPRECIWMEHMVFDPPLPEPIRMRYLSLGYGRPAMEVAGCPQCSFSGSWYPSLMPPQIMGLYEAGKEYFEKGKKAGSLEDITALLKDAPPGERFTKAARKSAMGGLRKSVSQKADTAQATLYAAINAIDLDWRVPPLETQMLAAGKNAAVDFQGVARVRFSDVEKRGEVSLKVKSGMPAIAKGFEPGRPLASYSFGFKGRSAGDMDISIYFGGMNFTGDPASLRLLRWDGKAYTDITTVINVPDRIITGRTDKLSTFVVMSRSSQPMKQTK